MPDWFYRTLARKALFALPTPLGRGLATVTLGTLGRSWPGRAAIDFLGHMRPPESLRRRVAGLDLSAPIAIGRLVDPEQRATQALARFAAGAIELGPVALTARPGAGVVRGRRPGGTRSEATLFVPHPERRSGLQDWRRRLAQLDQLQCQRLLRLEGSDAELAELAAALQDRAEAFIVPSTLCPSATVPTLRSLPWTDLPEARAGFAGVVLEVDEPSENGRHRLLRMPSTLPDRVRAWREVLGSDSCVVVAGGVEAPADALQLIEAGADLLIIDSGLVYTGPGLPKRINEAVLARSPAPATDATQPPLSRQSWFWAAVLGAAMSVGGASWPSSSH